mgnify:CR=1 FL=1
MEKIQFIDDGLSEEDLKKKMKLVDEWNFLICDYVAFSGDNIVDLNNLSGYLNKALKFYFDNLPYFSRDKNYLKTRLIKILMAGEDQLAIKTSYLEVSMVYYEDDLDKVRHFVMNYGSSIKTEIFEWLKEQVRYETLEVLMCIVAYDLQNRYPDMYKYLDIINESVEVFALMPFFLGNQSQNEKTHVLMPAEINALTFKFFDDIKAPQMWYEKYKYLSDNGLISYSDDPEVVSCCVTRDNIKKIIIARTNTIEEFSVLMHEFAHYMNQNADYDNENRISISEIPAIYFGELAASYLVRYGYSDTILGTVKNRRTLVNAKNSATLKPIIALAQKKFGRERISKSDIMGTFAMRELTSDNMNEQFVTLIDNNVDKLNEYLAGHDSLYIKCLGYIIGTNVAREAMAMPQDTVLPIMFDIASNLHSYDLDKVVEALNLKTFKNDENLERKLKK